jgi:hypothetical protein
MDTLAPKSPSMAADLQIGWRHSLIAYEKGLSALIAAQK